MRRGREAIHGTPEADTEGDPVIQLFRDYLPPYRAPIALVLLLLLVQAIANLYLPELNAEIINNGVATGDTDYILRTGGFMLAVTFVLMIAAIIAVFFSAKISMGFGRDVRSGIFRSVQSYGQVEVNTFGAPSPDHPQHERRPAGPDSSC